MQGLTKQSRFSEWACHVFIVIHHCFLNFPENAAGVVSIWSSFLPYKFYTLLRPMMNNWSQELGFPGLGPLLRSGAYGLE